MHSNKARPWTKAFFFWIPAFWVILIMNTAGSLGADPAVEKVWRLGVLFWHDSPNDAAALAGIREALEETEIPHELIIKRADSKRQAAIAILRQFKGDPVDLIFAMGTQAALLAAEEVHDIPVVFTAVTNPVVSGVVESWKGSGKNLAGNSNWIASETVLHVFRMAVPNLKKLGVLRSENVVSAAELRGMKEHLHGNGDIEMVTRVIEGVEEIRPAVEHLAKSGVQAIWIPIDILIYENMDKVLEAVRPHALPLVSSSLKGAKAGAVAGILVEYRMLGKRAVVIALDILEQGKAPGKIPIGTMQGYQVIVNLGAARRCHYELPLSLLVLADSILEDVDRQENKDEK